MNGLNLCELYLCGWIAWGHVIWAFASEVLEAMWMDLLQVIWIEVSWVLSEVLEDMQLDAMH